MPQLSLSQRIKIEWQLAEGKSYAAMAREIGVHRSTVKREVDRNSQQGQYDALYAHSLTANRKKMQGEITFLAIRRLSIDHFDPKPGEKQNRPKPKRRFYKSRGRQNRSYQHNTYPCTFHEQAMAKVPHAGKSRNQAAWIFSATKLQRYPQYYKPCIDIRYYREHPYQNRSEEYDLCKRRYDNYYRWRDYQKEEDRRFYRRRSDFLNYKLGSQTSYFGLFDILERERRRMSRERYMGYTDRSELRQINKSLKISYRFMMESIHPELFEDGVTQEEKELEDLYAKYAASRPEALRLSLNNQYEQLPVKQKSSPTLPHKKEAAVDQISFFRQENAGKALCIYHPPFGGLMYARPPTLANGCAQKLPVRCRGSDESAIFSTLTPSFASFHVALYRKPGTSLLPGHVLSFALSFSFLLFALLHLLMRMWRVSGRLSFLKSNSSAEVLHRYKTGGLGAFYFLKACDSKASVV